MDIVSVYLYNIALYLKWSNINYLFYNQLSTNMLQQTIYYNLVLWWGCIIILISMCAPYVSAQSGWLPPESIDNTISLSWAQQTWIVITGNTFVMTGSLISSGIDENEQIYEIQEISLEWLDTQRSLEVIQSFMQWVKDIAWQLKDIRVNPIISDQQYDELKDVVMRVIRDIVTTNTELMQKIRRIQLIRTEMNEIRNTLRTIANDIEESKVYIIRFTKFLYDINNQYYDRQSNLDELKLLIKSDRVAWTLSNEALIQSLIIKMNDLISAMRDKQQQQKELLKKINILHLSARDDIVEYKDQINTLNQKKEYLQAFLRLYKMNASRFKWWIQELFNSRKEIQSLIQTIWKAWADNVYRSSDVDIASQRKALEQLTQYGNPSQTPFSWPILPVTSLWVWFKDADYQKKYGVPHLWLEIPAEQWSPLYAARDGVVLKAISQEGISINWIVLWHTDGMISAYVYLNTVYVKEWQIVRRGQLLWYSWWEPWTRWAWFSSKWPNIQFEIMKNGVHIDPLSALNLSIIADTSILPTKYQVKYLRDISRRPIDITTTTSMSWNSIMERRMAFLQLYGMGIFRQVPFREDAAAGTNIDVDMGICIAFAESTMGKYLSTENNIGNVGNNDRWDRVPFGSALAGARSIYNTLNNTYLWDYNRIDELSRYGNKQWSIYASSAFNRQNNVMRCLTMIKWYYVPEDYPFRISLPRKGSMSFGE